MKKKIASKAIAGLFWDPNKREADLSIRAVDRRFLKVVIDSARIKKIAVNKFKVVRYSGLTT